MTKKAEPRRPVAGRARRPARAAAAGSRRRRESVRPGEGPSASTAAHAKLAGMSDAAVRAKTGRTWEEWARALDRAGAARRSHREIAAWVHERHRVPGWWAQTVAVGYERIRGLRAIGQRRDGSFEAHKTRTFAAPVARLYGAFTHEPTRRRWLPAAVRIRTATRDRSARMTWEDGTPVEAYFTGKGPGRSQVAIQHRRLATRAAAARLKEYWGARLAALAELLGGGR